MSVSLIDKGPLQSMLLGIQGRLQLAFPPNLFQFEIMPSRITPEVWARLTNRPPFIGLGWTAAENRTGATYSGAARFSVFLVVNNQSGEFGRLMGDSQGPGLFQVVQAAVLVLNGFKVPDLAADPTSGATVGTCVAKLASNASVEWAKETLAVAVLEVEVSGLALSIARNLQGVEATADLWNEIASGWVFSETGDQVALNDDYTFWTNS